MADGTALIEGTELAEGISVVEEEDRLLSDSSLFEDGYNVIKTVISLKGLS